MTIKPHNGPADGVQVMAAAVAARMPRQVMTLSPLGGAPLTGRPVPLYHLALNQIGLGAPLASANRTGWRYPIVGGATACLADIRGDEGAVGSKFGGLSYGIFADRFLEASTFADAQLGNQIEVYEPRLLDVPALSFAALWLEGSTSRFFISLFDGDPPGSAPFQMVTDIIPELKARAGARASPGAQSLLGGSQALRTPTN